MFELRPVQLQTQHLKMTAELRQAISLLQYSTQELVEYIRDLSLENPLIELKEPEPITTHYPSHTKIAQTNDIGGHISQKEASLEENLLQQVRLLRLKQSQMKKVTTLIFYLNEEGYLREDLEELSNELLWPQNVIEEALTIIQSLEPAGIGARNLQECLALQYKRLNPEDSIAVQMITHHLDEIAERNIEGLAECYNVALEDIEAIIKCIQTLNPKPGLLFDDEPPVYIRPEVIVDQINGNYEVRLENNLLPDVQYNSSYHSLFNNQEATHYLQRKYKEMLWLKKSIEQRQSTLLKISRAIMENQTGFLHKGLRFIAPLTLKDIAETLGIHESTVSRTVRNKYIQTPQGVYELRSFFSSRITSSTQNDLSATSVKMMIKDVVGQEDKKSPLSDQEIVRSLKMTIGVNISRRTVTKYRRSMNIPSSTKRKQ